MQVETNLFLKIYQFKKITAWKYQNKIKMENE